MSKPVQLSEGFHAFIEAHNREGETMEETLRRLVGGPHPEDIAAILSGETAREMRAQIEANGETIPTTNRRSGSGSSDSRHVVSRRHPRARAPGRVGDCGPGEQGVTRPVPPNRHRAVADDVAASRIANAVSLQQIETEYGDDAYGEEDEWTDEAPALGENASR
jgi:hypothetical protein